MAIVSGDPRVPGDPREANRTGGLPRRRWIDMGCAGGNLAAIAALQNNGGFATIIPFNAFFLSLDQGQFCENIQKLQ